MREFLEQVIAGIAAGGIYASLALALVLIYRAMGLINFAQGEFAMFTAFICWALLQGPQLPFGVALAISVGLGFLGALAIERIVVRPFERGSPLVIVIVTLALFEIVNSVAGFIWGYTPRSFPSPFPARPVDVGGILISIQDAAVMGGIDSPVGAVVGGLALGVMLALIGAYLPALADLRLALSLLLIVVLLVVRPSGLFGQHLARRV